MSKKEQLELFEQIYYQTYKDVLKFIICKCNNINDIDDIIQDTYLEVFRMLKKRKEVFKNNKMAYIISIAKSKIAKSYRKNKNLQTISIFQGKDDDEYCIDIDSRNRFRIECYYEIWFGQGLWIFKTYRHNYL